MAAQRHEEWSSSSSTSSSKFAYVTLLCDPVDPHKSVDIRMLLVLKENIRQFDHDNDIVCMVQGGINEEQWELLDRVGIRIFLVEAIAQQVTNPEPLRVPDDISDCYRSKVNILELSDYDKVIFIDNDIYVKRDLRFMFEVQDEFFSYEAYESPYDGGFFAIRPSHQAFQDIRTILQSDSFDPQDGWNHNGPFPHWRFEGHDSDWSFWCAHADRGILYYYYAKVTKTASIHPMKESEKFIVHFTGWNKPVMHKRYELYDNNKHVDDLFARWYRLWDTIESQLDGTGLEWRKTTTTNAVNEIDSRVGRVLDPYCDPAESVSLWVYETVNDSMIGPLGTTLTCADRATLVATPACKDKVKFKIYDSTTGKLLAKNTETEAPMSMAGDHGDDLLSSPILDIAGSYKLEINPTPGKSQTFYFDVECP